MKKILILAMAALPLFGIAQDKEKTSATSTTAGKTQDNKLALENPEVIYIELLTSTNSAGAATIRVDFGREVLTSLNDKELTQQLTEMRTMTFPSMPDAMNFLASKGYKFQQNYVTYDKDGKPETHFVYEKRLGRKTGPDGMKPNRPDRPETGSKPATDVKPGDKTPVKQPEKGTDKPASKPKQ